MSNVDELLVKQSVMDAEDIKEVEGGVVDATAIQSSAQSRAWTSTGSVD
mgnify:CR=1 FL=1